MTTSALPEAPPDRSAIDMVTELEIAGSLNAYLALLGSEHTPLIKYRRGGLTLVTPLLPHSRAAIWLDNVVKTVGVELKVPFIANGSTLYRREDLDIGIMADRTYYFRDHDPLADVDPLANSIDVGRWLPPDLAIEVVVSHSAAKSLRIYSALGVPEVWVFDDNSRSLSFHELDGQGSYVGRPVSPIFPFLSPADVLPWLEPTGGEPDNHRATQLRAWVRDVLGPRRR